MSELRAKIHHMIRNIFMWNLSVRQMTAKFVVSMFRNIIPPSIQQLNTASNTTGSSSVVCAHVVSDGSQTLIPVCNQAEYVARSGAWS